MTKIPNVRWAHTSSNIFWIIW